MKYLLISIFVHILIVNFIWVGFSVSAVHKSSSFVYLGETLTPTQGVRSRVKSNKQDLATNVDVIKEQSSAFFDPWLKMRQVDKPQ